MCLLVVKQNQINEKKIVFKCHHAMGRDKGNGEPLLMA